MADKQLPQGVKSETVIFRAPDGSPTEDKANAIGAEVTRVFDDGRTERVLYRRRGNDEPGA